MKNISKSQYKRLVSQGAIQGELVDKIPSDIEGIRQCSCGADMAHNGVVEFTNNENGGFCRIRCKRCGSKGKSVVIDSIQAITYAMMGPRAEGFSEFKKMAVDAWNSERQYLELRGAEPSISLSHSPEQSTGRLPLPGSEEPGQESSMEPSSLPEPE